VPLTLATEGELGLHELGAVGELMDRCHRITMWVNMAIQMGEAAKIPQRELATRPTGWNGSS